jgi:anti-sigma B factor antagonist
MEIIIKHDIELRVELKGRLDTSTSPMLDNKLKEEEIKEKIVVLDFKDLEYISSAGLRVLLALKKQLEANGKSLEIHNINNVVREVFEVTGFKNILNIK